MNLTHQMLWPTPTASLPNDGETLATCANEAGTGQREPEEWQRVWHATADSSTDVAHSLDPRCADPRSLSPHQVPRRQESRWEQSPSGIGRSGEGALNIMADPQGNTERRDRVGDEWSLSRSVCGSEDGFYNDAGQAQSGMGRGTHGIADWLDRQRWPSLPGEEQEAWEPPRTISHKVPHRAKRLKALGNAVVPQQIYAILKLIVDYESAVEHEIFLR